MRTRLQYGDTVRLADGRRYRLEQHVMAVPVDTEEGESVGASAQYERHLSADIADNDLPWELLNEEGKAKLLSVKVG